GFKSGEAQFVKEHPGPNPTPKSETPFFMYFSSDTDMQYTQGSVQKPEATLAPLVRTLSSIEKRILADPKNATFDDGLDLSVHEHGDVPRKEISLDDTSITVTVGPIDDPKSQKTFVAPLSAAEHDRIVREWRQAIARGIPSMVEDADADGPQEG